MVDNSVTTGTFTSGTVTLYGASANDRVVINADGMAIYTANVLKATAYDAGFTAYGDDINTKAVMGSAGMTIFNDGTVADPGTGVSHFGTTMRIGAKAAAKTRLEVSNAGKLSMISRNAAGNTDTELIVLNTDGTAAIAGTVTIGGTAASTVVSGAGLGATSNQDSTGDIQAGTSATDVGLENVDNTNSQGTAQAGLIAGTTITGGGITLNGGGVIKTTGKDSSSDTTAGFFLGREGDYYTFGIGDSTNSLVYDGDGSLAITGAITATTGFIGGTGGWTIADSKISSTYDDKIIGLVQQSAAHADVGSVSAFYAGASADTGEDAEISFGGDGKIRGTGIYVRGGDEFVIAAEKIFGDGSDGTLYINRFYDGQPWRIQYFDGNDVDITDGTKGVTNSNAEGYIDDGIYGDAFLSFSSGGGPDGDLGDYYKNGKITQNRDVYLKRLIIGTYSNTSSGYDIWIHWDLNGYRLFVQQGIFICGNSSHPNGYVKFHANGSSGGDGVTGTAGSAAPNLNNGTVFGGNGGAGGPGGAGHTNDATDNLLGGPSGVAGKEGGDAADLGTKTDEPGASGSPGNPGPSPLSTTNLTFDGRDGVSGEQGQPGAAAMSYYGDGQQTSPSGGGTGATGTAANASTKLRSIDPHLLTTFRDLYGTSDTPYRIAANAGNGGSTGGASGTSETWDYHNGTRDVYFTGGGGGGAGGNGGNGGIAMIVTPVIDYNRAKYGNDVAPDGATGQTEGGRLALYDSGTYKCYIQANGGHAGSGGDGGCGGAADLSTAEYGFGSGHGYGGQGGGGAAGIPGNGGVVILITSNRTPSSGGPLGTLSSGHFANVSADAASPGKSGITPGSNGHGAAGKPFDDFTNADKGNGRAGYWNYSPDFYSQNYGRGINYRAVSAGPSGLSGNLITIFI